MLKSNPLSVSAGAPAATLPPGPVRWPSGSSPIVGPAARPPARSGVLHYLLLLHVFLFCTRVHEFIPQLRIAGALTLLLLAGMGLTMRSGAILWMPGGRLVIAFTAWVGLCVPFSIWVGGSVDLFQRNVQALLTIMLMAAFIQTVPEAIRTMYTVGLASAFNALTSFVAGWEQGGRLVIGEGTLSDPNFYCMYVMFGMPFILLAAYVEPGIKRVAAFLLLLPMVLVIARTGSRGGLIALAVGLILLFLLSPSKQKIFLSVAAVPTVIIAVGLLPDSLITRFKTIVNDEGDASAVESSAARKELFFRSLEITVKNPIVGVGPGMFTIGDAAYSKDTGRKAAWHTTHNTYTQLSSEVGIPGALLFISSVFQCYRGLSRIRRKHPAVRIRTAALFAQISAVVLCVSACFLSLGYGGLPYILIGVTGTFLVAVTKEQNATAQPVPSMATGARQQRLPQHVITKSR